MIRNVRPHAVAFLVLMCQPAALADTATCFDFEALDPGGQPAGWVRFNQGAVDQDWVSNEDDSCDFGFAPPPPTNTGGVGRAACVRPASPTSGSVNAYICSSELQFHDVADGIVTFQLDFQAAPGSMDEIQVLVGQLPPSLATVSGYQVAQSFVGGFGEPFGRQVALSTLEWPASGHMCVRYSAVEGQLAMVDSVSLGEDGCGSAEYDQDYDTVSDADDNCLVIPNASQRDTDLDGFGNRCDADFSGDCIVNVVDLGRLKSDFFMTGDLDTDMNGDNVVGAIDLGAFKSFYFERPGPSSLADCGP